MLIMLPINNAVSCWSFNFSEDFKDTVLQGFLTCFVCLLSEKAARVSVLSHKVESFSEIL